MLVEKCRSILLTLGLSLKPLISPFKLNKNNGGNISMFSMYVHSDGREWEMALHLTSSICGANPNYSAGINVCLTLDSPSSLYLVNTFP